MSHLAITYLPVDTLTAAVRNARTHSPKQLRKLARALRKFGFEAPILCDANNRIIAGHARRAAAKLAEMSHVPVIRIDDLTPEQAEAFALFENRISEDASWSQRTLALILHDLEVLDLDFDLTNTGFEMGEIDFALSSWDLDAVVGDERPSMPPARTEPPVSMVGDLFSIGDHRLLCGDARDDSPYAQLLGGELAQMVITDVPYNVRIAGNVSGLGKVVHGEFAMASGEMSRGEYVAFLNTVMSRLASHSADGSIHFHLIDFRHLGDMFAAGEGVYAEIKNLCVWVKQNAGMGSLYRSQHELVVVFKSGTAPHIHNVLLGKHGRNRTNVWRYAGVNSFGKERDALLAAHPTVKPVDLVADAILDCSDRGGLILDPFVGSGTTLLAAERTGRCGYGIELDPYYVDVAIQRLQAVARHPVIHVETGLTFEALRDARIAGEREQAA